MSTFPQKHIDIVGIGASTLDRFIVVDHYPTGREVQQVVSSTTDGGGPVATALAVAGKYGARTAIIDSIGDDMVGRHILDDFEKYNVNTEAIQVERGAKSGVATILVKQSTGERAVFFERSTATAYQWSTSPTHALCYGRCKRGRHYHFFRWWCSALR